jgi:dephospho-CoA kinase
LSAEEFNRRDRAQRRRAGSLAAPDIVLYNDGSPEELERKASVLWEYLVRWERPGSRRTGADRQLKKEER